MVGRNEERIDHVIISQCNDLLHKLLVLFVVVAVSFSVLAEVDVLPLTFEFFLQENECCDCRGTLHGKHAESACQGGARIESRASSTDGFRLADDLGMNYVLSLQAR